MGSAAAARTSGSDWNQPPRTGHPSRGGGVLTRGELLDQEVAPEMEVLVDKLWVKVGRE